MKTPGDLYNEEAEKNLLVVMGYGFSLENNATDQYALKTARRIPKVINVTKEMPHNYAVPKVPPNLPTSSVAAGPQSSEHSTLISDTLDNANSNQNVITETQRQGSEIYVTEEDRPAKRRRVADIQEKSAIKTTLEVLPGRSYVDLDSNLLYRRNIKKLYEGGEKVATKEKGAAAHREAPTPGERPAASKEKGLEDCHDVDVYYIRLPSHRFGDYPNGIGALAAFPQKLLNHVSSVVANDRERACHTCKQRGIEKWDNHITRNKVNVMCHLLMVIQKKYASIVKWDNKLPRFPQNQKQFHAARYRMSQLLILKNVLDSLYNLLRDLSGLSSVTKDARVVRLEHILADSPSGFATQFRNALKIGLGTHKITKIREAGWVDLVFTLWVCGLWVWNTGLDQDDKKELIQVAFNARIFQWLVFLRNVYWRDLLSMDGRQLHGHKGSAGAAEGEDSPLRGPDSPIAGDDDPVWMIAESYMAVVNAAAASYPDSIFARPEWTADLLAWGLNIVTQEGFMCPNLEGKEGDDAYDEYMLFMECGEENGSVAEDAAGDTTGDGAGDALGDSVGGATGNVVVDTSGDGVGSDARDAVKVTTRNATGDAASGSAGGTVWDVPTGDAGDVADLDMDMRDAPA